MSVIITLAEVKDFLRIHATGIDVHAQVLIDAAEAWVSKSFGIALTDTSFIDFLGGGGTHLRTLHSPLKSVSELLDTFTGDVLDPADYVVLDGKHIRRNAFATYPVYTNNSAVPMPWQDGHKRYKVTYIAGMSAGDLAGMKAGMLHLVRRMYEARGNKFMSSSGVLMNWDDLYNGEIATLLQPFDPREIC